MGQKKSLWELFGNGNQGVSRRLFLKTCGASLAIASLPINLTKIFAAEPAAAAAANLTLTWSLDPKTTQTIAWSAAGASGKGVLQVVPTRQYQKNGWQKATAIEAAQEEFPTNMKTLRVYYATAVSLRPGTGYTYRVGDAGQWSEAAQFTTPAEKTPAFKFLVFGDSQSGLPKNPEYRPWGKTLRNAYAAHPDAAFFMNVGDLVEIGQDYAHWQNWYAAAKDVMEQLPCMAVPGNHETYDVPEENHSVLPLYFKKQLRLPFNGPAALKGQVYSFDYGDAHIAVLDSQVAEEQAYVPDMLDLQAKWLDEDLAGSRQEWKIVLFHKTPYYNKATRSNEAVKAALTPVLDRHHVDLVINGHDHGYSRTYPIYQDTFMDNPSKGTVYLVAGRSGNKYYTDLSAKVWDAFFHDPQAEPNYVVVTVAGPVLTIQGYTQSGTLLDAYSIDKQKKTDQPPTVLPEKANQTLLVIWGNVLQTPLAAVPPQRIIGVWYVPLPSFLDFIGGTFTLDSEENIVAAYQKVTAEFHVGDANSLVNQQDCPLFFPPVMVKGTVMLSTADVKKIFGFHSRYDANLNLLFLVK